MHIHLDRNHTCVWHANSGDKLCLLKAKRCYDIDRFRIIIKETLDAKKEELRLWHLLTFGIGVYSSFNLLWHACHSIFKINIALGMSPWFSYNIFQLKLGSHLAFAFTQLNCSIGILATICCAVFAWINLCHDNINMEELNARISTQAKQQFCLCVSVCMFSNLFIYLFDPLPSIIILSISLLAIVVQTTVAGDFLSTQSQALVTSNESPTPITIDKESQNEIRKDIALPLACGPESNYVPNCR